MMVGRHLHHPSNLRRLNAHPKRRRKRHSHVLIGPLQELDWKVEATSDLLGVSSPDSLDFRMKTRSISITDAATYVLTQ